MPKLEDLEQYINSAELLAKTKNNFVFPTTSPETAAIIISKIMDHSYQEVRIYDNSLNGDISDKHPIFFVSLKNFFAAKKNLKIILRSEPVSNCHLFDKLVEFSEDYPTQVELRLANENFKNNLKVIVEKDVNFTVNDVNSYRVENIESDQNPLKEAICNFNDKGTADKLINFFDEQFNHCERILLPVPDPA